MRKKNVIFAWKLKMKRQVNFTHYSSKIKKYYKFSPLSLRIKVAWEGFLDAAFFPFISSSWQKNYIMHMMSDALQKTMWST